MFVFSGSEGFHIYYWNWDNIPTRYSLLPELKLLDFIPIVRGTDSRPMRADRSERNLSKPSRLLKIRKASFPDTNLKFDEYFSFAVDLSNIGYSEIMVHEYVIHIDGKRQRPEALMNLTTRERMTLATQQRITIDISPLGIKNSGFHKIRIEVIATTVKCSKEVWFFISEDFRKLRYVEMPLYKRLLSPFF